MNELVLAMFNGPEVIIILALALILFGAKKLPELAKGLGQGLREFKKATREVSDDFQNAIYQEPPPPPRSLPAATVPAAVADDAHHATAEAQPHSNEPAHAGAVGAATTADHETKPHHPDVPV